MALLAVVAGMCALYALVWWVGRRDFRFFGTGDDRASSAMGGIVGELTELFQPGRRIEHEERARAKEAKQDPSDGAPPFEVDLDAGTARVRRTRPIGSSRSPEQPIRRD